jgi:hypothetical protein
VVDAAELETAAAGRAGDVRAWGTGLMMEACEREGERDGLVGEEGGRRRSGSSRPSEKEVRGSMGDSLVTKLSIDLAVVYTKDRSACCPGPNNTARAKISKHLSAPNEKIQVSVRFTIMPGLFMVKWTDGSWDFSEISGLKERKLSVHHSFPFNSHLGLDSQEIAKFCRIHIQKIAIINSRRQRAFVKKLLFYQTIFLQWSDADSHLIAFELALNLHHRFATFLPDATEVHKVGPNKSNFSCTKRKKCLSPHEPQSFQKMP